jgi:hypothetical protein
MVRFVFPALGIPVSVGLDQFTVSLAPNAAALNMGVSVADRAIGAAPTMAIALTAVAIDNWSAPTVVIRFMKYSVLKR